MQGTWDKGRSDAHTVFTRSTLNTGRGTVHRMLRFYPPTCIRRMLQCGYNHNATHCPDCTSTRMTTPHVYATRHHHMSPPPRDTFATRHMATHAHFSLASTPYVLFCLRPVVHLAGSGHFMYHTHTMRNMFDLSNQTFVLSNMQVQYPHVQRLLDFPSLFVLPIPYSTISNADSRLLSILPLIGMSNSK